jgi:hypothetical protein
MTTADTKTIEAVLAALVRERAAMLDQRDIPGNWTPRQIEAYETRRAALDRIPTGIRGQLDLIAKPMARRAAAEAALARLTAVKTEFEKQLADAPDANALCHPQEQVREHERQASLKASLRALEVGIEYAGVTPALPVPLRDAMTAACPTCGHVELQWPGPIPALEEETARQSKVIDEAHWLLDGYLKSAEALLGQEVAS